MEKYHRMEYKVDDIWHSRHDFSTYVTSSNTLQLPPCHCHPSPGVSRQVIPPVASSSSCIEDQGAKGEIIVETTG
jgi:hypothetical protein